MDFGSLLSPRPVEDILAERVRLIIGGQAYDLPVLTIRDNRAWRERMDLALARLVIGLSSADDSDTILELFDGNEHIWMDLLVSYDHTGVLPPIDEIEAGMTPMGLVRSVLEVWRAARPLADISATGMTLTEPTTTEGWRGRMSSWLRPTAGRPAGSSRN